MINRYALPEMRDLEHAQARPWHDGYARLVRPTGWVITAGPPGAESEPQNIRSLATEVHSIRIASSNAGTT
ncbi:MAG: hypothetical protein QG671_713 [Actinomycetota bacterium]|nr:hypothetical protein [Actinomycetota bacterium]